MNEDNKPGGISSGGAPSSLGSNVAGGGTDTSVVDSTNDSGASAFVKPVIDKVGVENKEQTTSVTATGAKPAKDSNTNPDSLPLSASVAPPPPILSTGSGLGQSAGQVPPVGSQPDSVTTSPASPSSGGGRKINVNKKVVATVFGVLILVGGLFAGLRLVGQQQDIREYAGSTAGECFDPPLLYEPAPYQYKVGDKRSPDFPESQLDWVVFPVKAECASFERLKEIFLDLKPHDSLADVYDTAGYGFTFNRVLSVDWNKARSVCSGIPQDATNERLLTGEVELTEAQLECIHNQASADTQGIEYPDHNARQLVFDMDGEPLAGGRNVAKPNGWEPLDPGYYQFDITPNYDSSQLNQASYGAGFIRVVSEPVEPPPDTNEAYCMAKQAYYDNPANSAGEYVFLSNDIISTDGTVTGGDVLVFRIRLAPLGYSEPFVVSDTLPDGLTFMDGIGIADGGCSYDSETRTYSCNVPSVASSEDLAVVGYRAKVDLDYSGDLENIAKVTEGGQDGGACTSRLNVVLKDVPYCMAKQAYRDSPSNVGGVYDFGLDKIISSPGGSVNPGETITFKIRPAPIGLDGSFVISDALDARFEFVDAGNGCRYDSRSHTVECPFDGVPDSNTYASFRVKVKDSTTAGASIDNIATVSAAGLPASECVASLDIVEVPTASCQDIKLYDTDWNLLTSDELKSLETADTIRVAVAGAGDTGADYDKARFRVNSVAWDSEVTQKRAATNQFYFDYKLPKDVVDFSVEAQVHHVASNKWY